MLADDLVEIGVGQRLAAGDGDDAGAEPRQVVDAAEHLFDRDGLGDLIVLIAVGAGEIAEAHGHDLRHDDVVGRGEGMGDGRDLPDFAGGRAKASGERLFGCRIENCSCGCHALSIQSQRAPRPRVAWDGVAFIGSWMALDVSPSAETAGTSWRCAGFASAAGIAGRFVSITPGFAPFLSQFRWHR